VSRSVTINRWCDGCAAEAADLEGVEPVEATHSPLITLDRIGPRTLDLCDLHNEPLVALGALLAAYGVTPEGSGHVGARGPYKPRKGAAAPLEALTAPGAARKGKPSAARDKNPARCLWCPLTYAPTGGGIGRHLASHGFTESVREAFGSTCPICGVEGVLGRGGQHLTNHGARLKSSPHAFALAIVDGDPFGVVAERFAAAPDRTSVRWTLEDYRAACLAG
jgi:hypothetical protein